MDLLRRTPQRVPKREFPVPCGRGRCAPIVRTRQPRHEHPCQAVDWDKAAYAVMKGPFVERVLRDMKTARLWKST